MGRSASQWHRYQSYLLRLWRGADGGPWQISVHNVQTGEQRHFASPEALFHFLLGCMEGTEEPWER